MDNEDLEVVATYLATKREIAKHKGVIRRYQESMGSLVEVLKKHDPEDFGVSEDGALRFPRGLSRQHWYKSDVDFEQVIQSIAALHRLLPKQRELASKMRGIGQADLV